MARHKWHNADGGGDVNVKHLTLHCLHQQSLQTGDCTEIDPTLFCQFLCAVYICLCVYAKEVLFSSVSVCLSITRKLFVKLL